MTISAKVVADSVSPQGIRLTTMQLRYPKFIHGEFMSHRVFSRNASSSRAIPVERLIQDVLDDPATPVFWGKNQRGMQAAEELVGWEKDKAIEHWLVARDNAVDTAYMLAKLGAHKQIVNRLIEPWCHINVVVTATEWVNFFALRRHEAAQPEMRALADAMWEAREASTPRPLPSGAWHVPYVNDGVIHGVLGGRGVDVAVKTSVARCARVSYLTHEGKPPNIADDLTLYERLVGSVPLHASPTEHQATPDELTDYRGHGARAGWLRPHLHGNLTGWVQFRKTLPDECMG